jgi:hypothetical protein
MKIPVWLKPGIWGLLLAGIKACWATFGVANTLDSTLARACAVKLYAMKNS